MTRAAQRPPEGVDTACVGPRQAAEMLRVTDRTIERWADEGLLRVEWRTQGGHRRFSLDAIEAFRLAYDGEDDQ